MIHFFMNIVQNQIDNNYYFVKIMVLNLYVEVNMNIRLDI